MEKLTQEELLERDREYLEKAASVGDWERELIEEGLTQGKRLLPDYLSAEQPIVCPVWRLRLWVLQHAYSLTHPQDVFRQLIWGLDYDGRHMVWGVDFDRERTGPPPDGARIYVLSRKGKPHPWTPVEIPVEW